MIEVPRHFWISNTAFYNLTGIRYVCFQCGLGVETKRDPMAKRACPGKRKES